MPENEEKIYESQPSKPMDSFWLKQGEKMFEDSLPSIREAAKSLMTGLGVLEGIYLGILGFSDFVPKTASWPAKGLFLLPLLFWLLALYCCLCVMMTKTHQINLHSPESIRQICELTLKEKQKSLLCAFMMLAVGLITVLFLMVYRLQTAGG